MKPERIAVLLLILMLIASAGNLILLKKTVFSLVSLTESVREDALNENWEPARKAGEEAEMLWNKRLKIFQLTLRHAETAQVTQFFSDLSAAIDGADADEAAQSAAKIAGTLTELLRLEEPRMSTVF